ncbi:MAG: polysaccharide biosynthesis C-terminal domain-containing protein [Vampirovibrionia bacterium]
MSFLSAGYNLFSRLDVLMLSIWVSYDQIAIYNSAFQLSAMVAFLPYAIGRVVLPKISALETGDIFKFVKKVTKPMFGLCLLLLTALPILPFIPSFVYGKEYSAAGIILQVFWVNFIVLLGILVFEQAFLALGKPKYSAILKYIQIIIVIIANIILIPKFGYISAAINVLLVQIIYSCIILYMYHREHKYYHKTVIGMISNIN